MKRYLVAALFMLSLLTSAFSQRTAMLPPVVRFSDSNGSPLAFGMLYTYQAGTTTPLATYSDSTSSTLNPNPVVLDSTGSASVFLGPSVYKFALQNAAGVVQWTADNIGQPTLSACSFVSTSGPTLYTLHCGPTGTDTTSPIVFPNPVKAPSVNAVLNPTSFAGADLGAQINAAQASSSCATNGCILSVPPGIYTLATVISIATPNVALVGNGATLIGSASMYAMISITGSRDKVKGFNFSTNGANYGVLAATGTNQEITDNSFGGISGIYIGASGSPSGLLILGNSFDGTTGCAYHNNISVFLSAHVEVSSNRAINTCGFNIETSASNQIVIHGNTIRQDTQQQSITATSGQTSFVFNWPSTVPTINRVWLQVNGVPTFPPSTCNANGMTPGSGAAYCINYTSATVTTVVMPAQTAGAQVTALGWTGLENIQVNTQSFNVIVDGNAISGGGDAGIDVVSDYHLIGNGTATASANQQVFTITASPGITTQGVATINGNILTPDRGTVTNTGSIYTIALATPAPAGTVVTLDDYTNNQSGSVSADFPAGVTIQNNVVKEVASACIAPEVSAQGVIIQGNTLQDCGMGVPTAAFSSGIFTGNAQVSVKNNTISNTRAVPTMASGISVQCGGCETGAVEKMQLISGNTYQGSFPAGKLYIPALFNRQSGIDVSEGVTIPYPEQPNFDQPWGSAPSNTHYFTYTYTGSGATRNTSSVIGGVASMSVPSGYYVTITPTDQIFFYNSILRVSFWAQVTSGTPIVSVYSNFTNPPSGLVSSTNVSLSGSSWKQYSIYFSMVGMDTPPIMYFRADGTNGAFNIQHIVLSATPVATGATTGTGISSSVTDTKYVDAMRIGTGANMVYRCTTAGALPVGAYTSVTSNCSASVAVGLSTN